VYFPNGRDKLWLKKIITGIFIKGVYLGIEMKSFRKDKKKGTRSFFKNCRCASPFSASHYQQNSVNLKI
jgi:hypothetical protein